MTDNKYIHILYEKSQLNRLVWGSLTLAPIIFSCAVWLAPDLDRGEADVLCVFLAVAAINSFAYCTRIL